MGPVDLRDLRDLRDRRLYLCTPDRPDLGPFVAACIEGGVDVVQLRDKHLPDGLLIERAAVVQSVCADRHVPFVLNDRPDLAAAIGADGVHVGQDDMSALAARRVMGDDAIIGLSTHATDQLDAALGRHQGPVAPDRNGDPTTPTRADDPAPVDYISAGPVSPTPTKPGRPGTGLRYVAEATRRSPWPVWVTGGVDPTTVPGMVAAGGRHFVVVRWLTGAAEPRAHARALRSAIDAAIGRATR